MNYRNNVHLVGIIQRDVELKKTPSGKDVASGTIKTVLTLQDGREIPSFHKIVAWQSEAIYLAQIGKDGAWLDLEGSLSTRSYDDKEGKKVYVTEVTVNIIKPADEGKSPDDLLNF